MSNRSQLVQHRKPHQEWTTLFVNLQTDWTIMMLCETSYHGIIVTVDHDGPPASKVNILLPPVTHLCNTKRGGERRSWCGKNMTCSGVKSTVQSWDRNSHSWRPTRTWAWGTTAVGVPGSSRSLSSSLSSVHTSHHPSVGALTPDTVHTEKAKLWDKGLFLFEQGGGGYIGQKNKLSILSLQVANDRHVCSVGTAD